MRRYLPGMVSPAQSQESYRGPKLREGMASMGRGTWTPNWNRGRSNRSYPTKRPTLEPLGTLPRPTKEKSRRGVWVQ